jgi:hypothetical protein
MEDIENVGGANVKDIRFGHDKKSSRNSEYGYYSRKGTL